MGPTAKPSVSMGSVLLSALIAGCGADGEFPADAETNLQRDAVEHGFDAWSWEASRAVSVGGCTGTLIAPRWVITAAHCSSVSVGTYAIFYAGGTTPNPSLYRTVTELRRPCGVTVDDDVNCEGQVADIMVLRLNDNAPASTTVAKLAWQYPGDSKLVLKVGAGNHDAQPNPARLLKWVMDRTYGGSSINHGHFLTIDEGMDEGDSGGPAYYDDQMLGVLTGAAFEWEWRALYNNVPHHLDWILTSIEHPVPYAVLANRAIPYGTIGFIRRYTGVRGVRACRYACDQTAGCRAYSHELASKRCDLYSSYRANAIGTPGHEAGWK